jgi:hypothetical protein
MLVLIGATPEGKKELVGFQAGVRESTQSWRELLVEIKRRGLSVPPRIAVGDGALGFWKALDELFPGPHHQRCWLHKTANLLNKVPKSVQPSMKAALREIFRAPTRAQAEVAVDLFAEAYGARYPKAVECVRKDQRALLAFYDWPAEHWIHLRTTNPIESVFATVRHRTVRTKGSLSSTTARLMVFKLVMAASKTWRRLMGENQLPKVIAGVRFRDGIEVIPMPAKSAIARSAMPPARSGFSRRLSERSFELPQHGPHVTAVVDATRSFELLREVSPGQVRPVVMHVVQVLIQQKCSEPARQMRVVGRCTDRGWCSVVGGVVLQRDDQAADQECGGQDHPV